MAEEHDVASESNIVERIIAFAAGQRGIGRDYCAA